VVNLILRIHAIRVGKLQNYKKSVVVTRKTPMRLQSLLKCMLALAWVPSFFAAVVPGDNFSSITIHAFVTEADDAGLVRVAAKEARRYLTLLSGRRPQLLWHGPKTERLDPGNSPVLIIATAQHPVVETILGAISGSVAASGAHVVHSNGSLAVCTGATGHAALYAVYTLLERCGARFYLHGDVLPDANASFALPTDLHETLTPRFAVRGLQPFHDFPMGPDWCALQ
jgi:hypothetical protein